MAEENEQLVVDLVARVGQFEREMKRAEGTGTQSFSELRRGSASATKAMADDFDRSSRRVNEALSSTSMRIGEFSRAAAGMLRGSLGVALGGTGVLAVLASMKSELIEIDKLARRTGMSAQQVGAVQMVGRERGVGAEVVGAGLTGLSDKLAAAARGEGELGKLFEANNIKLKDRNGQVLGINQALEQSARLMQGAANESDKIKLTEMLGLSREWIPLLERGQDAWRGHRDGAERATGNLDEMVRKAKAFDEAWQGAWNTFQSSSKVVLYDVGRGLSFLADEAIRFVKGLNELQNFRVETGPGTGIRLETPIAGVTNDRGELLPGFSAPVPRSRPTVAAPTVPRTIIPSASSGGGSGSGASETDTAENRLKTYTDSIARQTAVLQAQIDTFGRSNAERRAAEELARAAVDLNRLDAETRQTMTGKLLEQVRASETARQRLEELNKSQERMDQLSDANKEFGKSIFTGALSGKNGIDTLTSSLDRLRNRLLDMAFDQFWESMFPKNRGATAGLLGGGGLSNVLGELFGKMFNFFPKMATGGEVRGPGTGTSDSVLTRLSNGEHVTNARSAGKYRSVLEAINADRLPSFAQGGFMGVGHPSCHGGEFIVERAS